MENQIKELLQLPLETLVVVASGYLAYRLAYTGKDSYHKAVDVLFITTAFAVIAQMTMQSATAFFIGEDLIVSYEQQIVLRIKASGAAFVVTMIAAAVWRVTLAEFVRAGLRKLGVSFADRNVSAWETIIGRENALPEAISVTTDDGMVQDCTTLADYQNELFGPLILGNDGSVAFYVTERKVTKEGEWEAIDPRYEDWGPELTYIPASKIESIRMRHGRKPSLWARFKAFIKNLFTS